MLPIGYHEVAATDDDFTPNTDFPLRKFYLDYGGRQCDTSVPPTQVCSWGMSWGPRAATACCTTGASIARM